MNHFKSNDEDKNEDFYSTFNADKNQKEKEEQDNFYSQVYDNNKVEENNNSEEIIAENIPGNNEQPLLNNDQNDHESIIKKFKRMRIIMRIFFAFLIVVIFSTITVFILAELKLIKLPWLDYPEVLNLSQNEVMLKKDTTFQFSSRVFPSQVHYGRVIYESSDPTVADVNSITGYVEAKSNGMATIKAYLEDYKDVIDTCNVVVSNNNVMVESITVENDNIELLANSKYILKYSYSPNNAGLHYFTYTSSDDEIISVSSMGEVMAHKPGQALVIIIDEVSGEFATQEFTVIDSKNYKVDEDNHVVSKINVSATDVNLVTNGEYQVTASVYPETVPQTVTFSSVNNNIATVSDDGLITGVDYGTTQIIVTAIDGTNKVINVNVQEEEIAVTGISLKKDKLSLALNDSSKISYTISPKNATNQKIIWESSDERIASVNSNGKVKGLSVGSVIITATTDDGDFIAKMNVDVYIPKVSVPETDLQISKNSFTLKAGQTANVTATVLPNNASNKSVTWKSSDDKVATVSKGMIYAKSPGNATITVKTNNKGITRMINVVVSAIQVNSIALSETNVKVGVSGTTQLYVTYSPSNASNKNVTWSSSNSAVATVNSKGMVNAHRVGVAEIIATSSNGKVAKCKITVTNEKINVQSVKLDKTNYTVKENGTIGLTSIITPSNATIQSVTFKSDNENVAKVLSNGRVQGVREGVAKITATTNNGKKTTSFVIVKNNSPSAYYLDGTTIKYWADTSYKNYAITHIWVKDAYKQFKTEIPDKFGRLANPNTLMQKASRKNSGKALIGVNGSGFVTENFSRDLYNTNHGWKNTSVSPIVIYEGKLLRDYTTVDLPTTRDSIFGMPKNGILRYYYFYQQKEKNNGLAQRILNDGVLYTFGWRPVLVYDGKKQNNLPKDNNIRQSICQQDSHNFLFITNITSNRGKGFSPNSLANKMVELGCEVGFNLDGGGSTSLYQVKKGSSKPSKIKVMEGSYGRSVADILYFYGD